MLRKITRYYRDSYAGLGRPAWVLFFAQLINSSGSMVLFFLTLYLTRRLGFPVPRAGLVLSLWGFGQLGGSALGGWLSDRLGPARVQLASLLGCGGFFTLLGQVSVFPAIVALVLLAALANGALYPANMTSMTRVCPPEIRSRGFALNRLANNLGFTLAPVLGGFLAMRDYRLLFWVDGLTSLAAAMIFRVFFRDESPAATTKTKTPQALVQARGPWRDGGLFVLLGLWFFLAIIFIQLYSTYCLYLREGYGLPENRIGWLLLVNTLLIVTIEMPLLHAIRRAMPMRMVALGSAFTGIGFALMPFGRGWFFAALSVAVWTAGEMLSMPLFMGLIAGRASREHQGRTLGLASFAFNLAFIVGPVAGTAIYQSLGPTTLWLGCGLLGLSVCAGLIWLDLREGRSTPP